MKDLKGTKTEANLAYAFAGESQARNKYDFFAKQASKEGYEAIAAVFRETAINEHAHAKEWFKLLEGGSIRSTEENLVAAAAGENEEWTSMYKEFAEVALEEGFPEIAAKFKLVGDIEKGHDERYQKLIANLKNGEVFVKTTPTTWVCRNCGYTVVSEKAPVACPVCAHPQAYFEVKTENF